MIVMSIFTGLCIVSGNSEEPRMYLVQIRYADRWQHFEAIGDFFTARKIARDLARIENAPTRVRLKET